MICNSMTVVPHWPDAIETWRMGFLFCPPLCGPEFQGGVRTRRPGTNKFGGTTFSADGAAEGPCYFKKRPGSQKRAFHKVETRDLAGNWRGCVFCPIVPCWWSSQVYCTKKKVINEDQFEESGIYCSLGVPERVSATRTRKYVNGLPTNGFDDGMWYRDPGCAGQHQYFFAKKVG